MTGWQGHTASPCDTLVSGNFITATNCRPTTAIRSMVWHGGLINTITVILPKDLCKQSVLLMKRLLFVPRVLTLGTPYMFKFLVQRQSPSGTQYSLKIWPVGSTEPTTWDEQVVDSDTTQGSIVLAAFQGDVSFGAVTITAP